MNNIQSLQYFLPELLITITALFVIVFDLISQKKSNNLLVTLALFCITWLLYQLPSNGGEIFNGMLINDKFSFYFNIDVYINFLF